MATCGMSSATRSSTAAMCALAQAQVEAAQVHRRPAQPCEHRLQLHPEELRHAGQQVDVVHRQHGEPGARLGQQHGALGRVRQPQRLGRHLRSARAGVMSSTISGSRTTGRPMASATARTVTSSWVGPMPPLVKT